MAAAKKAVSRSTKTRNRTVEMAIGLSEDLVEQLFEHGYDWQTGVDEAFHRILWDLQGQILLRDLKRFVEQRQTSARTRAA